MKYLAIIVFWLASIFIISLFWWDYTKATEACYFAKGVQNVIDAVVDENGDPFLTIWEPSAGDRAACKHVGEEI